jgi:hypothetical protein
MAEIPPRDPHKGDDWPRPGPERPVAPPMPEIPPDRRGPEIQPQPAGPDVMPSPDQDVPPAQPPSALSARPAGW